MPLDWQHTLAEIITQTGASGVLILTDQKMYHSTSTVTSIFLPELMDFLKKQDLSGRETKLNLIRIGEQNLILSTFTLSDGSRVLLAFPDGLKLNSVKRGSAWAKDRLTNFTADRGKSIEIVTEPNQPFVESKNTSWRDEFLSIIAEAENLLLPSAEKPINQSNTQPVQVSQKQEVRSDLFTQELQSWPYWFQVF